MSDQRTYRRVTPTGTALNLCDVTTAFERLHNLLCSTPDSFLERFTNSHETLEVRLTATGNAIDYHLGAPADRDQGFETFLRRCFPNTYEVVEETPPPLPEHTDPTGLELCGVADRRRDWQTKLTSIEDLSSDQATTVPLSDVAETLAKSDLSAMVQILLRPLDQWDDAASDRLHDLEWTNDTKMDALVNAIVDESGSRRDYELPLDDKHRIEEIEDRDARTSFTVNVRAAVWTEDDRHATRTLDTVANAFDNLDGTTHRLQGKTKTNSAATAVVESMQDRTVHGPSYQSPRSHIPFTTNVSRGIVADAAEAPTFATLDGAALPTAAERALQAVPDDRTAVPRPPDELLNRYHDTGLPLGHPTTQDDTQDSQPVVLPPDLQPMHVGWFGQTGAGKSTALVNAILANQAATDGLDLLIDPKGDGMAEDYLRAHYAKHGDLDDVYYVDCTETVPAVSFFDIRPELDADVPRESAVADTAEHYVDILSSLMGPERFDSAVRSPDVIRYLVRAMFDAGQGDDAFTQTDLLETTQRMRAKQEPPAVDDPRLQRLLQSVTEDSSRTFTEVMGGVVNRLEKVSVDSRVATLFDDTGTEFDLRELLDEDAVVVIDTGGLRDRAQHALTLVVLSELWSALRRRARETDHDDNPLVNCYLEEAAAFADADLLSDLLARSRAFDCSLALAMQYPEQLDTENSDAIDELLNNVGTYVTGQVPASRGLAERLATEECPATEVGNRLRALARGEWLVSLPAEFAETPPLPFKVASLDPAPASTNNVTATAIDDVRNRTKRTLGRSVETSPTTPADQSATVESPDTVPNSLDYAPRWPRAVEHLDDSNALRCVRCDARYDATGEGMERAVTCCQPREDVDRDRVPICDVSLKLDPEEVAAADYTPSQLLYLQAVRDAHAGDINSLGYDMLRESMTELQHYFDLDVDDVQQLVDDGLLRHDGDTPHRLFTVTPEGCSLIRDPHKTGLNFGHGQGDLHESSQHRLAVELGRRYLKAAYVDDPSSPVTDVVPYFDLDSDALGAPEQPSTAADGGPEADETDFSNRRLDLAALDAERNVVVAVEAERSNNALHRRAPRDYDAMAACDPDEAIWIVPTQDAGHDLLNALNDPLEGPVRVEKEYSDATRVQQFTIDEPGLTAVRTIQQIQRDVLD